MKVLLLLALFAAFFSAILLAITSYARSFKEAQAYIIPLMLLCLVPGVLCLMPGLEFTGWMAVTPLVNIVMLARDLLEGSVNTTLAVAAVCSTMFYIAAAIALAARIFGTDAILYGSPATWSDLVRRPARAAAGGQLPAAMLVPGADVSRLLRAGERFGTFARIVDRPATRGAGADHGRRVRRHSDRDRDVRPRALVERTWRLRRPGSAPLLAARYWDSASGRPRTKITCSASGWACRCSATSKSPQTEAMSSNSFKRCRCG